MLTLNWLQSKFLTFLNMHHLKTSTLKLALSNKIWGLNYNECLHQKHLLVDVKPHVSCKSCQLYVTSFYLYISLFVNTLKSFL